MNNGYHEKPISYGATTVNVVKFETLEGVQAWAEANGGEAAVRELVANQAQRIAAFDRRSVRLADAWLEAKQRSEAEAHAREQRELDLRATEAAERSAAAADRSERWAALAVAVALAALFLSAFPIVRDWLQSAGYL